MWLVMLDGEYSTDMTIIQFNLNQDDVFTLNLKGTANKNGFQSKNYFQRRRATMRKYNKFSQSSYRQCMFDVKIEYI